MMMDSSLNPRHHHFEASFVRQDLEAHRDLWKAVWFEQKASGSFDYFNIGVQQTFYFLVPTEGMDALLMQLAARWFPENMIWLSRNGPFIPEQLSAFKQKVLFVRWSA